MSLQIRMIAMQGKNSHPGIRGFSRVAGFTIIELMVAVTLFAITMALALPSYAEMVEKRELSSLAQQLGTFVSFGQLEATRRNEVMTLSWDRDNHEEWCVGLVVGADACDCTEDNPVESDFCAVDGAVQIMNNSGFDDGDVMHKMEGNGSLSFDPIRGILIDPDDVLLIELHTDSRDYKVNLLVDITGDVLLCSKDAGHELPGFDLCPVVVVES